MACGRRFASQQMDARFCEKSERAVSFKKDNWRARVRRFVFVIPYLEQQAIPRAAIPNCTNHVFVIKTLGESGFDAARFIERFQLFGGELQIQTGEIVLKLRCLPRSNDRNYWHRSMVQPGERDLRHAATGLRRD